jgi:hypothetical protein
VYLFAGTIVAAHPEIVAALLSELAGWKTELRDPLWPPVMHFHHDIWGRKRWFGI